MTGVSALTPAVCALARAAQNPAPAAARLGISEQQVLNLARLAAHLRTLPEDYELFEMKVFFESRGTLRYAAGESKASRARNECGTVACAVGHGPGAGVAALPGEEWKAYAERCFVGSYGEFDYRGRYTPQAGDPLFNFMFGSEWADHDNTPAGAAARIACALDGDWANIQTQQDANPLRYQRYLD